MTFSRFDVGGDNGFQMAWADSDRVFYRGWYHVADSNRDPVLVVFPAAEQPTPDGLNRLIHEYGLKDDLDDAWAARPVALTHHNDRMALALKDPGGTPLDRQLGQPLDASRFLRIAIPVTGALRQVHERGLIHKDIKPANILMDSASGAVWLMGFGIASRLQRERQVPAPPEAIAGTFAYMAPEQTGRMNRSIDARSDINDVVREVMALVQRELTNYQALLRMELAPVLPMTLGDRVQLQQVIINLVMNGAEAMQSVTDRPRELVIRSRQDEMQNVLVGITDCGVGIPAENSDRVFNPFFTTKSSGMGMGLSICRSIIEAHHGRLWATANVPYGATLQFTLPGNANAAQ
jgi:hypothetical protein